MLRINKKNFVLIVLFCIVLLVLCSCSSKNKVINHKEKPEESKIFQSIAGVTFGLTDAGMWSTGLHFNKDGTFKGTYIDNDLGDTDYDYPNGTQYHCDFTGKIKYIEKINDLEYKLIFDGPVNIANTPGTSKIIDGVKYEYTEPIGLAKEREFKLILPGYPISDLSESQQRMISIENWDSTVPVSCILSGIFVYIS